MSFFVIPASRASARAGTQGLVTTRSAGDPELDPGSRIFCCAEFRDDSEEAMMPVSRSNALRFNALKFLLLQPAEDTTPQVGALERPLQ